MCLNRKETQMRRGVRLLEAKTSNLHSTFESDWNGIGVVKNSASRSETFVENTFDASNIVIGFSELNLCCDRCLAPPILMSDHIKERASCDVNTKI